LASSFSPLISISHEAARKESDVNPVYRQFTGFVKAVYFKPGSVRKVWVGPYQGITFKIAPQMRSRMRIFYTYYEKNINQRLEQIVARDQVVYDVGAHIGLHVLFIAKYLKQSGHIYAFEAWQENYDVLCENIQLNPALAPYITAVPKAVAETEGIVEFVQGTSGDGSHHISKADEKSTITVEAVTLDSFWKNQQNNGRVDLMIMDIEGAELPALKGASELIRTCRPVVIVEPHGRHRRDALIEWFKPFDYEAEDIDQNHVFFSPRKA